MDYGLRIVITREVCSRCGAVWIPDGDYDPNCDRCKAMSAFRFGKQSAEAFDRLAPPTRVKREWCE